MSALSTFSGSLKTSQHYHSFRLQDRARFNYVQRRLDELFYLNRRVSERVENLVKHIKPKYKQNIGPINVHVYKHEVSLPLLRRALVYWFCMVSD